MDEVINGLKKQILSCNFCSEEYKNLSNYVKLLKKVNRTKNYYYENKKYLSYSNFCFDFNPDELAATTILEQFNTDKKLAMSNLKFAYNILKFKLSRINIENDYNRRFSKDVIEEFLNVIDVDEEIVNSMLELYSCSDINDDDNKKKIIIFPSSNKFN